MKNQPHPVTTTIFALISLLALGGGALCREGTAEEAPAGAVANAAGDAESAPEALPTAAEVLQRYAEARGGRQAFVDKGSYHSQGVFAVVGAPTKGRQEVFAMPPNRLVVRIDMGSGGHVESGYDGSVAWSENPRGTLPLEGERLALMRHQAAYAGLWRAEDYAEVENLGRDTFNGKECFKLLMKTAEGPEFLEFFEVETGLHAGGQRVVTLPAGPPVPAETVIEEWESFGGLLFPKRRTLRVGGQETVITIEGVEYGAVDAGVFTPPENLGEPLSPAPLPPGDDRS